MNELNYRTDYGTSACATYAQVHVFGKKLFLTKISRFMENSSIKIFEYFFLIGSGARRFYWKTQPIINFRILVHGRNRFLEN